MKFQFSNLKNLVLENEETKMAKELSFLKRSKCNLILDCSTRENGIDYDFLKKVGSISGLPICFGYTLENDLLFNENYIFKDKQALYDSMKYTFVFGNENKLIPSFIGEIILSENGPSNKVLYNNIKEKEYLDICFKLSSEFNIPIFVKLPNNINQVSYEYFDKSCNSIKIDRKKIVLIITKVLINND